MQVPSIKTHKLLKSSLCPLARLLLAVIYIQENLQINVSNFLTKICSFTYPVLIFFNRLRFFKDKIKQYVVLFKLLT